MLILILIALSIIASGVATSIWYLGLWPIDCKSWRDIAGRVEIEKTPFKYKNCFK